MRQTTLVTITATTFICYLLIGASNAGRDEARLLNDLFLSGKYNSIERPVANDNEPVVVYFMVELQQIIAVDELAQLAHTNLWLNLRWSDYKLKWNPEDYGNISDIRYPISKLWKPDVLMYNSADEKFEGSYPVNAIVYSTGEVTWLPPGMFKTSCPMDIKWFPFDEQKCILKFGSWSYNSLKIDLRIAGNASSGVTTIYQRNGEWELLGFDAVRNVLKYECCLEEFIDLTFQLHIRRRTLFYMVNIVAPCVMMAGLTLLTFLIPIEAGSKLSFCVTILLSLTVFLLMVAQALPATSDTVPLIAIYFGIVMIMNAISVSCTVYVLRCHFRTVQFREMPHWIRHYVNGWLAVILLVKSRDKSKPGTKKKGGKGAARCKAPPSPSQSLLNNVRNEDDYSAQLHFLGARSSQWEARSGLAGGTGSLNNNGYSSNSANSAKELRQMSTSARRFLSPIMRDIFKEMKFITQRMQAKAEEDELVNEWRLAAKVIDRLMAWLFFAATTAVALLTLLSAPNAV